MLVAGQLAAHGALTLLGAHAGHPHEANTLGMLAWHAAALPAAVLALAALHWLLGAVTSWRVAGAGFRPAASSYVVRRYPGAPAPHGLRPALPVGMRAPPVAA
ncbi:MAG: hypothetical protein QM809_19070 [Gordonia sp. (in: high G+C Gram-positive bacteria)]|uniref:hypothetical protein n=1 Tax=Gordonia sp. (in: high G+C Gram-positive bacteria) TaxID=84139 RepID=UPI0039E3A3BE